jgi:hypothetical protein
MTTNNFAERQSTLLNFSDFLNFFQLPMFAGNGWHARH